MVEIRRVNDGIDEIVGENACFHLEQMDHNHYWFCVDECHFAAYLRWWPWPKLVIACTEECHTSSRPRDAQKICVSCAEKDADIERLKRENKLLWECALAADFPWVREGDMIIVDEDDLIACQRAVRAIAESGLLPPAGGEDE